jgi:hypothetical protein
LELGMEHGLCMTAKLILEWLILRVGSEVADKYSSGKITPILNNSFYRLIYP